MSKDSDQSNVEGMLKGHAAIKFRGYGEVIDTAKIDQITEESTATAQTQLQQLQLNLSPQATDRIEEVISNAIRSGIGRRWRLQRRWSRLRNASIAR